MELRVSAKKQLGKFHFSADFEIKGRKIGIFGPSGSGKSTLVSFIAGFRSPDNGSISLDGETLFDSSIGINIAPEHRRIGMVFQRSQLFPHLSVKNNLLYGYKRCHAIYRKIKPDEVIEVMQIGHLLKRGVSNLSGGEKQRVAIGRAILSNPRLLLMDEPLSAIDESLKLQIISYLKNTCDVFDIPYLFISHTLLEMRIMAEQVLSIAGGYVKGMVTAEELARGEMRNSGGYTNLLNLTGPHRVSDVYEYRWGSQDIFVANNGGPPATLFELPARNVILFKRHPGMVSTRNFLKGVVTSIFDMGTTVGVELQLGSEKLVAEVTKKAANQMDIKIGLEIFAAVKALAFKPLFRSREP